MLDEVQAGVAARDDEHGRGQRQLAVRERERLDVSGEVMDRHDRNAARPRERFRERDADEQRADEAGPWVTATAPISPMPTDACSSAASTTPQMSRTCWRDASSGTTPPHSRWMAACDATMFERMRQGIAESPRLCDDRRRGFVAGRLDGEQVHRGLVDGTASSAFFRDSTYGAVKMPRSVMMPAM